MTDVQTISPRKADQVADDLLRRIVRGDLAVGTVLPPEPELAEHFGVNRGVVREALKGLEVHGLVEAARRRGTVVLDPMASFSPAVLRARLRPDGRRVDPAALRDVNELRANLDAHMNGLAATRRTDEDLARMDEILARLAAAMGEPRRYARILDELALAIARASGNRLFETLVHWHGQVAEELGELFLLVRYPTEPQLQGVRFLVEAIRARDAETARGLSERFHEWASERMLAALQGAP